MKNATLSISYKDIWGITYPIIFGNLAQTLMVFVNTVFLGHLGTVELGAAMMAGMYYLVFAAVVQGFATGIQIIVSRQLGENNLKMIGNVFEHGLYIIVLLGFVLLFLLHFTSDSFFDYIIKSPNIYDSAVKFIHFRQWGIVCVCMNYLFRSLYIGLSFTKIITYSTIAMAGVNIFFDYSLIFGHFGFPAMGVAGAGLSSVMAELIATIIFFCYTFWALDYKKYDLFKLHHYEKKLAKSIVRLSLPTMFQRIIAFGSWFLFFALIEHLGERPIAISGIVRSVYMLCTIPVFAYSATANTVTSRLMGAKKQSEIPKTLLRILKLSLATILPLLIVFAIIPQKIAAIYTDDMLLAQESVPVLYFVYLATIILAVAFIYFEFVSGTGNTIIALMIESLVMFFYVGYIYLSAYVFKLPIQYIWISESVYGLGLFIGALCYMKFAPWESKIIR